MEVGLEIFTHLYYKVGINLAFMNGIKRNSRVADNKCSLNNLDK